MFSILKCCVPPPKPNKQIQDQIDLLTRMIDQMEKRITDYDNKMEKMSADQIAYRSEAKKLRIQGLDLEVKTYLKKYKYARDAYVYLETFWDKYNEMKQTLDKQMNQLMYMASAEEMINALKESEEFMKDFNQINEKIDDLSEKVKGFDNAILDDSYQLDDSELLDLEASLGDSSMEEIVDYLEKNLRRIAETVFGPLLVQELSSFFRLQYQQTDRLVTMNAFLEQDRAKAALCAGRTYESLSDLKEIMAFSDDATKETVSRQVTQLLTEWATDDVLRIFTETKLRDALDDFVASHLAAYTQAVAQPGASGRKCLQQLLEELSVEMGRTIASAWTADIREYPAVSGFQTRVEAVLSAVRAKEKKVEAVKYSLDHLPPVPEKPVVEKPVVKEPIPMEPIAEKPIPVTPITEKPIQVTPIPVKPVSVTPIPVKPVPEKHPINLPNPPTTCVIPSSTPQKEKTPPKTPEAQRIDLPEPPKNIIFRVPSPAQKTVAMME